MEPLKDPKGDRTIKEMRAPPYKPLQKELLFADAERTRYNISTIKDHLFREGKINKQDFKDMIARVTALMKSEPNLLNLKDNITVIGDIHGQYYDFVKLLNLLPDLNQPNTKYLFLGDYVDRGEFAIECVILIFAMKLTYPTKVFLLRGNHESRQLTSFFNFRTECLQKYDQEMYDMIMVCFDVLPLAAIVNGRFLCLHGGLSPELATKTDFEKVNRFMEPPQFGLFCDILWSDPTPTDDGRVEGTADAYAVNAIRGCSYFFGLEACNRYLKKNNFLTLIRAHEAQLEGYKCHHWGNEGFPQVITIFSAPNYCGVYQNVGGFITFENNDMSIQQFWQTDHPTPYMLPNNMDVWCWSVPFVSEKITEIFLEILKETRNDAYGILTKDEEMQLDRIMNHPAIKRVMIPDVTANREEVLTSQLELALNRKRSEVEHSEQLIKGLSLHDSILDKEVITQVSHEPASPKSPKSPKVAADPGVFTFVKGFDQRNEMRPSLQ